MTASWEKASGVSGYEIEYAGKKDFSDARSVTVKKAGTVRKAVKDLMSKKTYYMRIRCYKTVKGKAYYSAWSDRKSVKTR